MDKPQTKYFDGGYVKFRARKGELFFSVVFISKQVIFLFSVWQKVKDESHLKELLGVKNREYFTKEASRQ